MKKIVAFIALGALLVGFSFTQNDQTDLAQDLEPSIFSVEKPSSNF